MSHNSSTASSNNTRTGADDMTTDFLLQVARRRGRLGKGGVPNLHAAGLNVIGDWRDGRISGWVEAPTSAANGSSAAALSDSGTKDDRAAANGATDVDPDQKKVVKEWAAEFKLDGLWNDDAPESDVSQTKMDIA